MVSVSVLLLLVAPALAAADRCIQRTRYWGGDGPAQTLTVVNGHAFFGGFTLRVADLAEPADPEVVHEIRLEGYAEDLDTHGDRVFAVDRTEKLKIIDASVPARARITASFVPQDSFWGLYRVEVQNDLAMVGGRATPGNLSNLMLLDVSDPTGDPPLLGSLQFDQAIESIALGDHAAVATTRSGSIWFIDIGDPSAPFVALEMDVSDLLPSGEARDLETYEDLLAIADSAGKVTLIDISDPAAPVYQALIQGLDIGVADLGFEGPMLHATGSSCTSSGICGGYALVNCFSPRNPDLVGRVDGPVMASPAPHSGHVMAAAFEAGLRVVDLRGLTDPLVLDTALPEREAGAMALAGSLVHVVNITNLAALDEPDRNTLEILRKGRDGALVESSSYAPEGAIWALAGDGKHVAAAIYDEGTEFNSLEVIDVSDPSDPVMGTRFGAVLSVEEETSEPHLRLEGNRLYFSLENSDDILIYEISEGGNATQVGTYSPDGPLVNFVSPSDDVLFVAVHQEETSWINIVDISDPSAAVLAARFDLPSPADIAVSLDAEGSLMAILSQDIDGFDGPYNYATLVDISDPTDPVVVSDNLPASRWVAMGFGMLHGVVDLSFPPLIQHHALDLTDPGQVAESENLGFLDVYRDRVDAEGPYLGVSDGRLEIHTYDACRHPVESVTHQPVRE